MALSNIIVIINNYGEDNMKNHNKVVYIVLVLWAIATGYLFYKYSLQAGYWDKPLYISLSLYFLLVVVNKGFNKMIASLFLVYIVLGLWIIADLFGILSDVFGA